VGSVNKEDAKLQGFLNSAMDTDSIHWPNTSSSCNNFDVLTI
jgi:hypothetical protein